MCTNVICVDNIKNGWGQSYIGTEYLKIRRKRKWFIQKKHQLNIKEHSCRINEKQKCKERQIRKCRKDALSCH